ncbi:TetR/AcrR family transcriptional regulator [Litoribrevibacter albus]|uniref:TetR family transcriptional regulator n=1 Tax=Litoribrevibacter albus TaxID=1473156 RepID=A0AA37SAE3_9GAMM|nr:TetR/AcrR family transcriptional regulator [Litoribrevibacter albus]GLQ31340.1 TetR family transcriptional regulator [Litoribrevibacter albus]
MSDKRQHLVDTALKLFYEKGIHSIGINEILKVAGVAKKTLYTHFESKEALLLAALKQRDEIFVQWLDNRLAGAETNQQTVEKVFNALEEWFSGAAPELGDFRGCFFVNTSAEFSDPNSDISLYCQAHKQRVRELIKTHMPFSNTPLLDAICLLKEGAINTAYVEHDPSTPRKCIKLLNTLGNLEGADS